MITENATVTSATVRPAASSIARYHLMQLLRRHPLPWIIAPAALLVTAAATSDWRWLLASLAALFILLPMALAFAWLRALPSGASSLRPYTLSFTQADPAAGTITPPSHIIIRPLFFPHEEQEPTDAAPLPALCPWSLSPSDVSRATLSARSAVLALELLPGHPSPLLLIPLRSLPSPEARLSLASAFIPHVAEIL